MSIGDGLWQATARSGEAVLSPPGEAGAGRLKQGYQEQSNVQLVEEMVQLMVAQRAYEMNVKVMQAADEIAGMTNNLRK
jgi:flagellar basal-body rod protein FlgG